MAIQTRHNRPNPVGSLPVGREPTPLPAGVTYEQLAVDMGVSYETCRIWFKSGMTQTEMCRRSRRIKTQKQFKQQRYNDYKKNKLHDMTKEDRQEYARKANERKKENASKASKLERMNDKWLSRAL